MKLVHNIMIPVLAVGLTLAGCSNSSSSGGGTSGLSQADHQEALQQLVGKQSSASGSESRGAGNIGGDGMVSGSSFSGNSYSGFNYGVSATDNAGGTWDGSWVSSSTENFRGKVVQETFFYNFTADTPTQNNKLENSYSFRIELKNATSNAIEFIQLENVTILKDANGFYESEEFRADVYEGSSTDSSNLIDDYSGNEEYTYSSTPEHGGGVSISENNKERTDLYVADWRTSGRTGQVATSPNKYITNKTAGTQTATIEFYQNNDVNDIYATFDFSGIEITQTGISMPFTLDVELTVSGNNLTNEYEGTLSADAPSDPDAPRPVLESDLTIRGQSGAVARIYIDVENGATMAIRLYDEQGNLGSPLTPSN